MRAALLDEKGIFIGMDETESPGPRHLPQITNCDLPAGKYVWVPDDRNPVGGAFWPVDWLAHIAATRQSVIDAGLRGKALAERRRKAKTGA